MLYLQNNSTNLQKLFLAERCRRCLLWLKISIVQKFWFCNNNATNIPTSRKCITFNFSLYTVPAEMPYLQKCLTDFQKLSLTERRGRWLLWLKISIAQNFGFAIATLQIFQHLENVKISIFPFTLSQQKCYIFKSIEWDFKNFLLAARRGRWLLWLKTSIAEMLWFCNNNVTTFPTSRICINFNFLLYTVPAEMLYLQKYLTNYQKLSFDWKTRKVAFVDENFNCTEFWFCNSNVTNFPTSGKCKNFNFSLHTVPAEMLYLQKYLMNFQKLSFGLKMMKVALVVENF